MALKVVLGQHEANPRYRALHRQTHVHWREYWRLREVPEALDLTTAAARAP